MDVGEDGDAHRRRATIPVLGAGPGRRLILAAAAGIWATAAYLLLRTSVPAFDGPSLDASALFTPSELERIEAFRAPARWLWVASTLVELVVLGVLAWKAVAVAGWLRRALRIPARGRVRTGLALTLAAALAVWLATLPVGWVRHWWDRRYGLSAQGYGPWLGDRAGSLGITAAIAGLVVAGAILLAARFGRRWWIPGGSALGLVGLVVVLVQPVVIEPVVTRTTPLGDRTLSAQIEALGDGLGVTVGAVEVADASRRTSAANAQVLGLGPTRRVVLDDTLLDGRFSVGGIRFVAAHELGHVARSHVWKAVAWFALLAVPALALIAWILERRGGLRDPALVPLALLLAFALWLVTLPAQNAISRRYEAEADWLALAATGDPRSDVALQRRLALTGLIDPDPPAWSRVLLGTHPTTLERIRMAEAFAGRR